MLTKKKSYMDSYFYAYMWFCFYNYGATLGGLPELRCINTGAEPYLWLLLVQTTQTEEILNHFAVSDLLWKDRFYFSNNIFKRKSK